MEFITWEQQHTCCVWEPGAWDLSLSVWVWISSSYLSTSSAEHIVLSNWNKETCSLQGSVKLLWSWFLNHLQLLTSEEELMKCFPLLNHCDVWIDDALLRGKTFSNILWVSEITVTGLIWSHRCTLCCLVAPNCSCSVLNQCYIIWAPQWCGQHHKHHWSDIKAQSLINNIVIIQQLPTK